jgi:hypothetical protein
MTVVGSSTNDPIQPSDGFNESALQVYPNGDVLDVMRSHLQGSPTDEYGSYVSSISHDGGITFSSPSYVINPTLVGHPTLALQGSETLLVGRMCLPGYCAGTAGNTSGAISMDEGASFSSPSALGVGTNDCYDVIYLLQGGNIGLAECNDISWTSNHVLYYSAISTSWINFPNNLN